MANPSTEMPLGADIQRACWIKFIQPTGVDMFINNGFGIRALPSACKWVIAIEVAGPNAAAP